MTTAPYSRTKTLTKPGAVIKWVDGTVIDTVWKVEE